MYFYVFVALPATLLKGNQSLFKLLQFFLRLRMFIEEFQIIKDRTESELSSISEKAETEYDPNKSHSEQKELFDDLYARSNDVVTAATKKAFEIVEPHSADDAAAEPLAWIATKSRNSGVGRAAIDLLFKHHLVEVTINKISIGLGVVCRLNCPANVQPC